MTDWGRAAVPPSRGGAYAPPPPPPSRPRAGGPAWGSRPPGGPRRGGGSTWLVVVLGLVLAVAVAVAAIAVLRDEGGDQPAADVTGAELTTVLLTPADLGAGYAPAADAGEDEDTEDGDDSFELAPDTPDECRDVFEGDAPGETSDPDDTGPENPDRATVDYDGPHEATLGHTVETHVPGEITLDGYRSLVDGCDVIEISDGEATETISLTTTDLDGLGDDAVGLQIDMHVEVEGIGIDIDGYSVMWERSGVVSTIDAFAGLDQASLAVYPVDQAWVRGLAATADARLAVLLDG